MKNQSRKVTQSDHGSLRSSARVSLGRRRAQRHTPTDNVPVIIHPQEVTGEPLKEWVGEQLPSPKRNIVKQTLRPKKSRRFFGSKVHYKRALVQRKTMLSRSFALFAVGVLLFQIFSQNHTPQKAFAINGNTNQTGYIWENDDASPGSTSATFGATAAADSSSGGSFTWNNTGNVFANDNTNSSTGNISPAESTYYLKVTNFGYSLPTSAAITGISVTVGKYGSGTLVRDSAVRIVKGGTIGSTDRSKSGNWALTETAYTYGGTNDLWGTTWTPSDINNSGFGFAIAALNSAASNRIANIDYVSIAVYYNGANSQLAAANTSITAPKGSRVNLRAQIKNTSTQINFSDIGLFYDSGTGEWSKVQDAVKVKNAGSRSTHSSIDATGNTGTYSSVGVDASGKPWVSYYDSTNQDLKVARYIGGGSGTGCTDSNWTCVTVDATNNVGQYTSIAFNASGNPWISYHYGTGADLKVAQYVGSGGSGCASSAWSCTVVDTTNVAGFSTSIAVDPSGNPWIGYGESNLQDLKVARYVGGGSGSGCTDSNWTCTTVDSAGSTGGTPSVDIDSTGAAWVSYWSSSSGDLRVAKYVGSGGSGCDVATWTCTSVDTTGTVGQYSAISVDGTDNPWVSYYDQTNTSLKAARYVGSGGSGCAVATWNCSTLDSAGTVGQHTSITVDSSNLPSISYYDTTNTSLKIAQYIATGKGSGCDDKAWTCSQADTDNDVGTYTDIAINSDNQVWMSYSDATSSDILAVSFSDKLEANSCATSTLFTCVNVDVTNTVGQYNSVAIDPSGNPWVAYHSFTGFDLKIARYVGGGLGSGCADSNWTCYSIDTTSASGQYTSIAIDSSGNPWVSYQYSTGSYLRVARFVGGGTGSGCADNNWTCTDVDTSGNAGTHTSIAIDSSGNPWVSYHDSSLLDLKVAKYVGTGGSGCASTAWTCTSIDTGGSVGQYTAIAIDSSGNPWLSYYDTTNLDLKVARYVGSGGSGCASSAWTCTSVDTGGSVGQYTAVAIDSSGNPWVSYYDASSLDLKVAKYVTSGGSGCASSAWTCTTVLSTGSVGFYTSIAIDASGYPWISFAETSGIAIKAAHYIGGGTGTGCTDSNWSCFDVDIGTTAAYTSIAIDTAGNPHISYGNNTDLKVATINRQGEILLSAPSRSISTVVNTSHADMTTVSDTANRDDADCIGGGTWNNGVVIWAEQGSSGSLPTGSVTPQCTELIFTIDLSQATSGATYRFVVATNDPVSSGKNFWRGPVSITSGAIPTLTIADSTLIASQDTLLKINDCTNTSWGCESIESTNDIGNYNSMAIDQAGVPWVAYYDTTNANLRVARYIGSGQGTGCDNSSWTCESIDTSGTVGQFTSIAIDSSGNPWISYYYGTGGDLRVAQYVGSGGSGCASAAWTCTNVDTTNDVGKNTSISFDKSGKPWVSYYESASTSCDDSPTTECSVRLARYVGNGLGTGCASNNWSCQIIENPTTTGNVGSLDTNLTFGPDGSPWISYNDGVNLDLRVARYIGTGGTGCVDSTWSCVSVDTTNDVGQYSSIAVDSSGSAWVSYIYTTGTDLRVAKYVVSGGSGCASSAWTCTDVLTTPTTSTDSSVAIGPDGYPWVSSYSTSSNALNVSRYVGGTGGSGCASSAWTCSTSVDASTATYSRLAFDASGAPWVSYYGGTGDIRIAKQHFGQTAQNFDTVMPFNGVNAKKLLARFPLTLGKSDSATQGSCSSGVSEYYGLCGVYQNNGDYDSIITGVGESAYLAFMARYKSNSELPSVRWIGKTDLAPNTAGAAGDIYLQVYRYGTTNAWETIASDTASASCSSDNCKLSGLATGSASEYYQIDSNGYYWTQFRVYQVASTVASISFKTDQIGSTSTAQQLRGGRSLENGIKKPLNQR